MTKTKILIFFILISSLFTVKCISAMELCSYLKKKCTQDCEKIKSKNIKRTCINATYKMYVKCTEDLEEVAEEENLGAFDCGFSNNIEDQRDLPKK